jgi:hypothetical protein
MENKSFANRFGLIALMSVSLFASTAFAGNAPAPTQVVVTNTPAQPVPMVGLVKDSDAPARKSLQTDFITIYANTQIPVVSVAGNQRLVVEHLSGYCSGVLSGFVWLYSEDTSANYTTGQEYLPSDILVKTISIPVHFYVDPGHDLKLFLNNTGGQVGYCYVSVSGYYVNLP